MKVVILAGGRGTRLAEETETRPKPMVEIGGQPILWHIMSMYSHYGLTEFIICLGYKGYVIKEYFANYVLHRADVTFKLADGSFDVHRVDTEDWRVTLIDTGMDTMTGGRIRRAAGYIGGEDFCLTYGDGLSDVNLQHVIAFHQLGGQLCTLTAIQPPARFGGLVLDGDLVTSFTEKAPGSAGWHNGGFFVVSPAAIDYIDDDSTTWEGGPLERLASDGQLRAYCHHGFWQPMDTLRDKLYLEELWVAGKAPWRST